MGMSHDYAVAVEEGATIVRVGTAIFGARPPACAGRRRRVTARLRVRLTPRAGADRVDGVADGILRVRVAAAARGRRRERGALPAPGRAGAGLPRSGVRVASGATARVKIVEVDGVEEDDLRARWPGLA